MNFEERLEWLKAQHEALINRKNEPVEGNGIYERYKYPILTGDHAPLTWRYDLNMETNPYLMERFGIHATFNSSQGGRRRQKILLRGGRKPERCGSLPFLGPSRDHA